MMKSPLMVMVVVILGSLSFPMEKSHSAVVEQIIYSTLEQDAAFHRLSAWVEDNYVYSHCQYLWDGEDRIIRIRQGLAVVRVDNDSFRKFSYSMDIRISSGGIELSYSQLKPVADYRNRVAYQGLSPDRGVDYLWMREYLQNLGNQLQQMMN